MIVMILTFLAVLLLGAPIAFAFALSSMAYLFIASDLPPDMFAPVLYSSLDSFPLMAIPFFLFAGELMSQGGISRRIIEFSRSLVGRIKGFLGVITILSSGFFSAVSGSGVATVAAIGGMMIPEMKNAKYPAGYAAALTASGAFLGSIIPPSIPMVMYGFISNTSIGELFVAGVIPGILLITGFLLVNTLLARKFVLKESVTDDDVEKSRKLRRIWLSGKAAFLALLMPVIIVGGIYGGFFTPTESAVVAVVYALLVGSLFFREISWSTFLSSTVSSALNTSMLLITLVFATIFSRLLTIEQVPQKLADVLLTMTEQQWVIVLIAILFLTLIGMLMDTVTGVILATPIVFPILVSGLGMDPVHVGVITVVTLSVGLITPPMAINIFLAGKLADTSMVNVIRYLPGFLLVSYIVILFITYIPNSVLFLSKWMAG